MATVNLCARMNCLGDSERCQGWLKNKQALLQFSVVPGTWHGGNCTQLCTSCTTAVFLVNTLPLSGRRGVRGAMIFTGTSCGQVCRVNRTPTTGPSSILPTTSTTRATTLRMQTTTSRSSSSRQSSMKSTKQVVTGCSTWRWRQDSSGQLPATFAVNNCCRTRVTTA